MKKIKFTLCALISGILAFGFTACKTDRPFVNPGDNLGGGGIGEVAGGVDNSYSSPIIEEMQDNCDLSELSADTSDEGKIIVEPQDGIYEISDSKTYYFKGEYGGIVIANKQTPHLIFDGATITNNNGIAIDGTAKKIKLTVTLASGSTNTVTNGGVDSEGEACNAIHIKGDMLAINGKGTLNVISESKSAIKASKAIAIVDATLNLTAVNHAITGASVAAQNCTVNVTSAGKDGINAECDGATGFRTSDGFVALNNVNYTCSVSGDGIQASTVVYIDDGDYNIKTTGNFVQKTSENMSLYGMTADDFKYVYSGGVYKRIASDETGRYSSSSLYGLSQGCKGIKAGEIEYEDDNKNTVVVTDGDYLIAIVDGTLNIDSTDDSIHSNSGDVLIAGGTFTMSTCDDAITSDNLTKITGGNITITSSYEGIEGGYVEIGGGKIDLTASDDGINAASDDKSVTEHIIISGGDITVDASGDGIDSNGSILISGGTVTVHGPTTGRDAGLDADRGIVITGGTVFVTSTLGMVETPSSNSTQYVVSYAHQSIIASGSTVTLCDEAGKSLVSVTVKKSCQSIILSSPDLEKGKTYSIYGGNTEMTSFTISSIITTIGSQGGSFPGGGFNPGRPGGPNRPF
ncbi:MAG: carbohydrate-binding domain-containing protein [Clostridiales bacterium]|nr:carbohydrate-binding domain-containing protein [Clostridiales bacterium]